METALEYDKGVCVCVCVFIMEKGRKNAKIEEK